MTRREVLNEIDELQTAPLTMVNAKRLAILYIIKDHLLSDPQNLPFKKLTMDDATLWVAGLRNGDGSIGGHWTSEQATNIMHQHGVQADPAAFYAVINSLYSDYDAVFKQFGVSRPDFYAHVAKAWLSDPDAVSEKPISYFENIVRR